MEQKNEKFRFRLNLFDALVILAALAVAAFLIWSRMRPAAAPSAAPAQTVRYTLCVKRMMEGSGALVQPGDDLTDIVQNYPLGTVVSAEVVPASCYAIDEETLSYYKAEVPGREDVYIQVESAAEISESQVSVGGGYALRVGAAVRVKGPGYIGSGEVYSIERGEQG